MILQENQAVYCSLSGKRIELDKDDYLYFPNIVVNTKSSLYNLNDSFILKEKLNTSHKMDLIKCYLESVQIDKNNFYFDYITNEKLTLDRFDHPENIVEVGYLVSDINNPCYKYNNVLINKKNRDLWKNKNLFINELTTLSNSDQWGGNYITDLLDKIFKSPIKPPFDERMTSLIKNKISKGEGLWWMKYDG